jgi:ROS/MUCR transcriptional regulator protein
MSLREQITPGELVRIRQDPQRSHPNFVVCRECGKIYQALHRHVPAHHGIRITQYSKKWNNPPLIARSVLDTISQKHAGKPRVYARGKRSLGQNARRRTSLDQTDRKAIQDIAPVDDAILAEYRLRGKSIAEISVSVGLTHGAVLKRLRYLGFPRGRAYLFLHGEPVAKKHLEDLRNDFDVGPKQLIALVGQNPTYEVNKGVRRSTGDWRQGCTGKAPRCYYDCLINHYKYRRPDDILLARFANIVLDVRKRLTEKFCFDYYNGRTRIRAFRQSEVRDLPQLTKALKEPVLELRAWAREQKGGTQAHEILSWLCLRSRWEVGQKTGKGFRRLMFLWPALNQLLNEKGLDWFSKQPNANACYELLATDYEASAYAIKQAATGNVKVSPAESLGQIIRAELAQANHLNRDRAHAPNVAAPSIRQKRGRRREEPMNQRFFDIGTQVEKEIPVRFEQDRHSIVTARRIVSNRTRLQFDVVAQYHKRFRQFCARTGVPIRA